MGLLGRNNHNTNTVGTTGTTPATTGHRYSTRSHGPLSSTGPGIGAGRTNNIGTTNTGINGSGAYGNTGTGVGRAAVGPGGSVGANGKPSVGHAQSKVTGGKLQHGLGRMVGSASMQMKGATKVQQGEAEKVAAGHIKDADRLEGEAAAKRQMAGVAPGTHSTAGALRGGRH